MKIALTSLYANPLHPGHVECLTLSKALADELWVIVNNDHQAFLKRGVGSFQDEQFRMTLVASLKPVDRVIRSIDTDTTVCATLRMVLEEIRNNREDTEVIFTKGGNRRAENIPERAVLEEFGIRIVDGLGTKTHSSRSYIPNIANNNDRQLLIEHLASLPEEQKEHEYVEIGLRPWGIYYVLEDRPEYKVKKIIVHPGGQLSLQSHEQRSEHWVVVSGSASVETCEKKQLPNTVHHTLKENESCFIPKGYVHRLSNRHTEPLVIIEVQCGAYTGEDDIVRYDDAYGRVSPFF